MNNHDIVQAHTYSAHHKADLVNDRQCGCFYCLNIFEPKDITEWIGENGDTAVCPHCDVDAVIGESAGYPITKEFLTAMNAYWF